MKLSTPTLALAFLLSLLLAASSTAAEACAKEEEDDSSSSSCRQEMMQHSIHGCRSFLKQGRQQQQQQQQGALIASVVEISAEEDAGARPPRECCSQLEKVSEHCRCASIRDMLQEAKWEEGFRGRECRGRCAEMMLRGVTLPEMCDLRPRTCKMKMGGVQ